MAGFSRFYVFGGAGGFMGADDVNPIEFLILAGDADRQWLEPHYFNKRIRPMGKLRTIIPAGPDDPDSILDACIAFCPANFQSCPSFREVELALGDTTRLDFDALPHEIPDSWVKLREEARPIFDRMNVWLADLVLIENIKEINRRGVPNC